MERGQERASQERRGDQPRAKDQPNIVTEYKFQQEGNEQTMTCHLIVNFKQGDETLGDPIEFEELTKEQVVQLRDQLTTIFNTWGKEQQKEHRAA